MTLFVKQIKLRHYKSIAQCDVSLGPITVLVGRNGAGKSNFLDSLNFVRDALDKSLDHAIRSRGGIDEVRRRGSGHPHELGIELQLNLSGGRTALYGFGVDTKEGGRFAIQTEYLRTSGEGPSSEDLHFERHGDRIDASIEHPPGVQADRLYLERASGVSAFREIYDSLVSMGFYDFNPEAMRQLYSPQPEAPLSNDGANIASVLGRMRKTNPRALERLNEYIRAIAPRISSVEDVALGPKETFTYREEVSGARHPWQFYGSSMSDGMLRVVGILVAIFQPGTGTPHLPLIGIEEPETALHPAAAGVLVDALHEAAEHSQIVVTTHSPDLIDSLTVPPDRLLVVSGAEGVSTIAPLDAGNREAIGRHLSTAGELLRMDQLRPDPVDVEDQERRLAAVARPA